MKKLAPHWQILLGLLLATVIAVVFRNIAEMVSDDSAAQKFINGAVYITGFIGDLFIQALKMIIVPLVVSAIIAGVASLGGVKGFGRLGRKTLVFYLATSSLAILVGLTLVNTIQPGLVNGEPNRILRGQIEQMAENASGVQKSKVEQAGGVQACDYVDLFYKMIPENIFAAASSNGQLLGLIFFSLLFAIAMTRFQRDQMEPLLGSMKAINDVMIRITEWVMMFAPLGVFGLMLPTIYYIGFGDLFSGLGKYFMTVLLALIVHLCVIMPLVLRWVARVSPLAHFKAMQMALITAFSTASSAATLPETMHCVQKKAGVSKKVSSFTLPLGATVNMDGTALYECVAVIFVAQFMGIELSFAAQFAVVVTALLTSIGVAGVPSASLVAILLILNSSGIPNAGIAVTALLSVDRLLDMSRTAVNVFSDSCAAVIVAKSEGEDIRYVH